MAAWDLIGDAAQAVLCQAPHERGGEEPVVLAEDELSGHVRQCIKRPWRVPDRCGFSAPAPAQGLLGQRARYTVVEADERVVVAGLAPVEIGLLFGGLLVAGVVPPLARGFSGRRNHPGE